MATLSSRLAWRGVSRASQWDATMVALAAMHGAALGMMPTAPVIAAGLWWNSNTISHNFIHRSFFRQPWANTLFAAYLSVLLGIPQALWRDRHLAHHAGLQPSLRFSSELWVQAALVLSFWAALAAWAPAFLLSAYLPGYIAGLVLCALHGYYEHARGTTSHYGTLYNMLFFNDGYHVEHHAQPGAHWTHLPGYRLSTAHASPWPAPLRWMEAFGLEALERLVLRSPLLQRFVLRAHARALRDLIPPLGPVQRVAIVGGGLFPRTALILQDLLPEARLDIIDFNRANLEQAGTLLGGSNIELVHASYPECDSGPYDLVVIPLSFHGDRTSIYDRPPARAVLVHDWIWRLRGTGRVVSFALLKRINLIRR